jgi:60 kDa SS-A/Ro ribonucleoprotein
MSRYAHLARVAVPQSEPLDTRQAKNSAGGYAFVLDDWRRLERFLILGSDSNTYYQKARELTRENAKCVERCWSADADKTARVIVDISAAGRAPKNDTAIFALVLGAAHADVKARQAALFNLGYVCRTSTHLFQFVDCAKALGKGRGRAFNRAIKNWYLRKKPEALAYQMVKYRSREGYDHSRLLKTARPKTQDEAQGALFRWAVGKQPVDAAQDHALPMLVHAHIRAMGSEDPAVWAELVREHRLPWEALPTAANASPEVWRALLPEMGLTALIRNLGNMTRLGVLAPLSQEASAAANRIMDAAEIKRARVHPFNLLLAHATYSSGKGFRGQNSWTPLPVISQALEAAFYLSFGAWQPSGKRTLVALDVSGSMSSSLMGSPLEVCAGAAAMAMVTARTEPDYHVMAFNDGLQELPITASTSLEGVLRHTRNINGGGTDCALPMLWALQNTVPVDVFAVYTDSETWAGPTHPSVALRKYRDKMGIAAKEVVVGMTSTGFSIADPDDPGAMDVVGFDSAAPSVIADFARG